MSRLRSQSRLARRKQEAARRALKPRGPWLPVSKGDRVVYTGTDIDRSEIQKRIPPNCLASWTNNRCFVIHWASLETVVGIVDHFTIQGHNAGTLIGWSEMQSAKDDLAIDGRDRVGVQVFPKSSLIHDLENVYHLWVYPVGFDLPFALDVRGAGVALEGESQ